MTNLNRLLADSHRLGTLEGLDIVVEGNEPISQLEFIISTVIGIMTIVGSLWFTFQIITAALEWIGSEGDKGKLTQARTKITQSLTGLIILFAAYGLIRIVGFVFGVDIMNLTTLLPN